MKGRRIFIGDIQGCRVELEDLLEAVEFDAGNDELHPVGDLVNRGPDSLGVLRLLRNYNAGGVLGNHDRHTLLRARGERAAGKRDTLDELFAADDCNELLEWLAARPILRAWPDLLMVHAAISPAWEDPVQALGHLDFAAESDTLKFAILARYCDSSGNRPESDWPIPVAPFAPWYDYWQARDAESRTVVFGHWARNGLVNQPGLRGLDTGCVWGQKLTAWIAEEDRIVQVDAREYYSPTSLPD
ncbi:MAG: bis(5'-nucleosyl)-tetraphosphatase (symmetrical) [Planctomycetota bacterium]|jgi:bis(5'-nucleosyl)-tetraphosphatase (symmetrical)